MPRVEECDLEPYDEFVLDSLFRFFSDRSDLCKQAYDF